MGVLRPRRLAIAVAPAAIALAMWCACDPARPWVLVNTTPSEPPGLYVRSADPPAVGRLIAFRAPTAAFPYADARLGYLHHELMLKAVAAGPGDQVCTVGGRLVINGRDRAPIAVVDGEGRALPRWSGCRPVAADELFVLSDRVPNSFDSRYFGPVPRAAAVAVYTPLAAPWSSP